MPRSRAAHARASVSTAAAASGSSSLCQICRKQASKYRCSACPVRYCSVACYKSHKAESCIAAGTSAPSIAKLDPTPSIPTSNEDKDGISGQPNSTAPAPAKESIAENGQAEDPSSSSSTSPPASPLLKPLSTLSWPPEPDPGLFTDPLTRDDPKPLRREELLRIATSQDLRTLLQTTCLPTILRILDTLPPNARHSALSRLLEIDNQSLSKPSSTSASTSLLGGRDSPPPIQDLLGALAKSSAGGGTGRGRGDAEGQAQGQGQGWWLTSRPLPGGGGSEGSPGPGSKSGERVWIGAEEKRLMRLFAGSVCVAIDDHDEGAEGWGWGKGALEWDL